MSADFVFRGSEHGHLAVTKKVWTAFIAAALGSELLVSHLRGKRGSALPLSLLFQEIWSTTT